MYDVVLDTTQCGAGQYLFVSTCGNMRFRSRCLPSGFVTPAAADDCHSRPVVPKWKRAVAIYPLFIRSFILSNRFILVSVVVDQKPIRGTPGANYHSRYTYWNVPGGGRKRENLRNSTKTLREHAKR